MSRILIGTRALARVHVRIVRTICTTRPTLLPRKAPVIDTPRAPPPRVALKDLPSLSPHARLVVNHLTHAFQPVNQTVSDEGNVGMMRMGMGTELPADVAKTMAGPGARVFSMPIPSGGGRPKVERVGVLMTPYEGGDVYNFRAVEEATRAMKVEMVVYNATMIVAEHSAEIPDGPFSFTDTSGEEDSEENTLALKVQLPGGMRMMMQNDGPAWSINENMIKGFRTTPSADPRVVFVEGCTSVSETFDAWWPSLVEWVHRRRAERPTVIVLSLAPSHIAEMEAWRMSLEVNDKMERKRAGMMLSDPRALVPFNSVASDIITIIPRERDVEAEQRGRVVERRTIFKGQLAQVIPVAHMNTENETSLPWDDTVSTYPEARAIGQHVNATIKGEMTDESIAKAYTEYTALHAELIKGKPQADGLDKIKKGLNKLEKKLESCIVDPTAINVSFDDVHLPDTTIDAIRSMISLPLLYAEAFNTGVLRTHSTNGALLFGPPGTGKTLVAKAVAHECGARMLAVKASDINSKWLGEAEKNVKAVFSLARKLAPCIVFMDEVDALLSARGDGDNGRSSAHNVVLNEFMQEMDGLVSDEGRVIVIGATNRPFDLDDAILRRLPRRMLVDLPDAGGREAILRILLREENLDGDVDLVKLANETDGYSGSDLKHLCVSAALAAIKETITVPWKKVTPVVPLTTARSKRSSNKLPKLVKNLHTATNRTLAWRHFEIALKEIRPSATEEGTLPALRKWAEQFGEGGKRKQKGYGKGFGFSDEKKQAYGRVKED